MKDMIKYILCVVYILFSVSGLTLIKISSNQVSSQTYTIPILGIAISWWTLAGIFCYGTSFCIYLGVVSKFDLGLIIPLLGGIVNILILLVSFFILKEKLTINMIVGALIITVGIVVMNIKK